MEEKIYIFGAHSRGQTLGVYLKYLQPYTEIMAYLYDNDEPNPIQVEGTPVIFLGSGVKLHTDCPVYIGTRSLYHQAIADHLKELGFYKIFPVTVELDLQFRNEYLKKYFTDIGREFVKIDYLEHLNKDCSAAIYVAKSVFDKPLHQDYILASYEREIQVGAALTKRRFSDWMITDDVDDNISNKNRQFCELTALYWIWKHAKESIVGLVHYRRHFLLPEDWIERMQYHHIDVILPIPLYVGPSLAENFKLRHDPSDWDFMMRYLKAQDEDLYQEAEIFFQGNLYSPCNMFIMRKEVLDELCTWLFPILFAAAEHGGQKEDVYMNRYPGFLSERLITFFFEKHRKKYKIVYADKNFLQ